MIRKLVSLSFISVVLLLQGCGCSCAQVVPSVVTYVYTTPGHSVGAGFTYQIPNNVTAVLLTPTGNVTMGTVIFPTAPGDGQLLIIGCASTMDFNMSGASVWLDPGGCSGTTTNNFLYQASTSTWWNIH
nr:hypothetical protein [uncultured Rhodopila sp.]